MSETLKNVVKEYEKDNDLVLQFLENRCIQDRDESIRAKDLYKEYKIWVRSEGEFIMSARRFNSEIKRHSDWVCEIGILKGYPVYKGFKLKEEI